MKPEARLEQLVLKVKFMCLVKLMVEKLKNTTMYMVDDRNDFSFCSFMDNLFIMGGFIRDTTRRHDTVTCFKFNTKSLKWKGISRMNNARKSSASSVFEGRIVVSGGKHNFVRLNTVEVYDHVGDTW